MIKRAMILPLCRMRAQVEFHQTGRARFRCRVHRHLWTGLIFGLFLTWLQISKCEGNAPYPTDFMLEGTGGSESFSLKTAQSTSKSFRTFSANFRSDLWKVRFVGPSKDLDYVEIGTDGTNIFTVKSTESLYDAAKNRGLPLQNSATAVVTRGPNPKEFAHPHAAMLWLVFASQKFLQDEGTNSIPPLLMTESNSEVLLYFGFRQKAQLTTWSSQDLRPRRMVWFHDGVIRDWAKAEFSKVSQHRERRRKPPFDIGFTNAILEVTQQNEVGNHSLGMRLDYKVFAPKPEATTNSELALLQHHWLLITNLIMGKTPDTFVPQPPKGIMRVGDLRFAVTEGNWASIEYAQSNSWLTDVEAALRLAGKTNSRTEVLLKRALVKDSQVIGIKEPRSRIVLMFTLLLPTLSFLAWCLVNLITKNKRKHLK